MAVSDWLSPVDGDKVTEGVNTLVRAWVLADSVAAPITPRNVTGIVNHTPTPFQPQTSKDIFHKGAGEDGFYRMRSRFQHELTVQFLSGYVEDFLADIKNVTMGTDYALPHTSHDDPLLHLEFIARKADGTHVKSEVYRDLILMPWSIPESLEDGTVDISFYSKFSPFSLYTGAELVVDKFDGDGSTTDFTLSSEPLNLTTATNKEHIDWYYDEMVEIIYKLTSEDFGSHQKSGYSNSTTTLTATTAPAASSTLTVTYAKATT